MKFLLKLFDTLRQNFRKTSSLVQQQKKRNEKVKKIIFWEFFQIIFFHKIFVNCLYLLKIENKHIEVESQSLFKLRKSLVTFQWLYLQFWPLQFDIFPHSEILSEYLGAFQHSIFS